MLPRCTFAVSPAAIQSPASGGSFPITVQTDASCSWIISGFQSWTTLALPPPLGGPATLALTVAANTGPSRDATLAVAGQLITITQAGALLLPSISLVTNAFGTSTTIAPNTWVTIYGAGLAPPGDARAWQDSDFASNQCLPRSTVSASP